MEVFLSFQTRFVTLLFAWLLRGRSDLEKENLLLRHQLIILKNQIGKPKLSPFDRSLLSTVSLRLDSWKDTLLIVKPDILLSWHRRLARWKWTSTLAGRPRIVQKLKALMIRMKRENRLWGPKRIHGEFMKLGLSVSETTIRSVLRKARLDPWDGSSSGTWKEFINRHKEVWAMDFFTVHSASIKRIYVFLLMNIHSRELISTHVTSNPSAEFVRNTLGWELAETSPEIIIRDRDPAFESEAVELLLKSNNVITLRCPRRSPKANAFVERLNGTLQRECTDHFLFFTEGQLKRTLDEYRDYYNHSRCHQGLGQRVPRPKLSEKSLGDFAQAGSISSRSFLSGLHHDYFRCTGVD